MITALPEIARNAGTTRILRGYSLTSPVGNPSLSPDAERAYRKKILFRALELLGTKIEEQTIIG
jgi:glycine reductase complex component B subunit gamma